MKPVVTANTAFALDLFAQLSADTTTDNLFFSPYSVSMALAMVAEGARGETAEQMGKVLRFPDSVRNTGPEAAVKPWNLSLIHTGLAALTEFLTGANRPDAAPLRAKIQTLRQQLDEANRRAEEPGQTDAWGSGRPVILESQRLAAELNQLLSQVDQYELRVANALWGQRTYPFLPSYIETLSKYYKTGGIFAVDFIDNYDPSIDRINAWVEEQTNRRIKEMIPKDAIAADERLRLSLVVTNAIYFFGEWAEIFPATETKADSFWLATGGKIQVPMMHHGSMSRARYGAFNADGSFFSTPHEIFWEAGASRPNQPPTYPAEDGFAVLELPYKGEDLAMVLIAPRAAAGLPAIEKKLAATTLDAWLAKLERRPVEVYMPRFCLATTANMSQKLVALGMKRAFTHPAMPAGAQFDGMCSNRDPRLKLYVSQVLHKAFVEVTEKGTAAAAATAITMPMAAAIVETVPFDPTFRADKPFVFCIRETKSGCILFLGRVTAPPSA